jgi:hypothetical protein
MNPNFFIRNRVNRIFKFSSFGKTCSDNRASTIFRFFTTKDDTYANTYWEHLAEHEKVKIKKIISSKVPYLVLEEVDVVEEKMVVHYLENILPFFITIIQRETSDETWRSIAESTPVPEGVDMFRFYKDLHDQLLHDVFFILPLEFLRFNDDLLNRTGNSNQKFKYFVKSLIKQSLITENQAYVLTRTMLLIRIDYLQEYAKLCKLSFPSV